MARIGNLRDAFDRDMDFVTVKQFKLSGTPFIPGQAFDKTLVNTRRLRQLYDNRYLRMVEPENPIVREKVARPVIQLGNAPAPGTEPQQDKTSKPKVKRIRPTQAA